MTARKPANVSVNESACEIASDICIIGAGPGGLAVARALRERNLSYTHLERNHGVGGIWDIDAPGTPMYESAHFNSSKTESEFGGYPMPESFADYPSHRHILEYLHSFAEAYGLTERIEFGVEVTGIEQHADETWTVSRVDGSSSRHRYVVMATGSQWYPNIPEVPGFTGDIRHSMDYRSAGELTGKRVLVVGGGNSAADIACDAARVAERSVISMRRGYWFIPKHLFGRPVDTIASGGPSLPMWFEQLLFGALLRLVNGDPRRLGLQKPDHKLFETHPTLTSLLLPYLQHGDIIAKPGIAHAHGETVVFTDGSRERFDVIVMATGFVHKVPYAQKYLSDEQHPDLYLSAFSREHAGLFGVGYVETNAGAYPLFDLHAQMIAGFIDDSLQKSPNAARFAHMIRYDRPDLSGGIKFDGSPRHKGYVNSTTLLKYLRKVVSDMGWRATGNPPPARPSQASVAVGS
ncbi:flavin-containing monooxygenase [Nocardia sp. CA-120079]|uniref:flavin-containing monooxygenase n=1 Tax=Nocardia sp. CA-120079 TaxID=3239974 RepID=UPI003D97CF0C